MDRGRNISKEKDSVQLIEKEEPLNILGGRREHM